MKIFKNEVGRPSNETIRKRNIIKVSIVAVAVLLVTLLTVLISNTLTKPNVNTTNNLVKNSKEDEKILQLANINELSDGFMNKYHEDFKTLNDMNNMDNVLIVMSKNEITDNFGATFVVNAPNNTYFLQYNNDEECKNALSKFKELKATGKIVTVSRNVTEEIDLSSDKISLNKSSNIKPMSGRIEGKLEELMGLKTGEKYVYANLGENIKTAFIGNYKFDTSTSNAIRSFLDGRSIDTYDATGGSGANYSDLSQVYLAHDFSPYNFTFSLINIVNNTKLSDVYVINALTYATRQRADVIQINYASSALNNEEREALKSSITLAQKVSGAVITAPSARPDQLNNNYNFYPASFENVISISGFGYNGNNYTCYNQANKIDFGSYTSARTLKESNKNAGDWNLYDMDSYNNATTYATIVVSWLKSYNRNLLHNDVVRILERYANKSLSLRCDGIDVAGRGIINTSNTNIFIEAAGSTSNPTEGTTNDGSEIVAPDFTMPGIQDGDGSGFLQILKALGSGFSEILKAINWSGLFSDLVKMFTYLVSSCQNIHIEQPKTQEYENIVTPAEEKPNTLTEVSGNYLITNYKKVEKMKKQKDYACDAKSDCYASAYYMKLVGKVPVSYYANCNTGTVKLGSCRVNGKIKYLCSSSCPNAKVTTGNLANAYLNVVSKNKPSILKIKNGNETHTVVIVGITKDAYRKYKNSANNKVSINDFVVLDVWDGKIKEINKDTIKNIKTGWEFVEVKY